MALGGNLIPPSRFPVGTPTLADLTKIPDEFVPVTSVDQIPKIPINN
jgi:hypothetical protein